MREDLGNASTDPIDSANARRRELFARGKSTIKTEWPFVGNATEITFSQEKHNSGCGGTVLGKQGQATRGRVTLTDKK